MATRRIYQRIYAPPENDVIYCTPIGLDAEDANERGLIWTFDRATGLEVDDGLDWGPRWQRTGSELVATNPDEREFVASVPVDPVDPVARTIEIFTIKKPVEGLDELYERDRSRFADAAAERVLGVVGRMIASSKSGYHRAHPRNVRCSTRTSARRSAARSGSVILI